MFEMANLGLFVCLQLTLMYFVGIYFRRENVGAFIMSLGKHNDIYSYNFHFCPLEVALLNQLISL